MKRFLLSGLGLVTTIFIVYYFFPYGKIPFGVKIDRLVILKSKHRLLAYAHDTLIHTYPIAIGKNPLRDKQFAGDQRTPEGEYFIDSKNPFSAFHKNLGISYPNAQDLITAKKFQKPAGGEIKIHGLRNDQAFFGRFQRWKDWTNGCIALTNEEIDDLYLHTPIGTPVSIRP